MENQVKVFGMYQNSRNGRLYRVVNVVDGYVYYVPSYANVVYRRPVGEWFGLNRHGDVRFVESDRCDAVPIIDADGEVK